MKSITTNGIKCFVSFYQRSSKLVQADFSQKSGEERYCPCCKKKTLKAFIPYQ